MMYEILIPIYLITFSIVTPLMAKSQNKNPIPWLFIGAFTGVIGFISLLILEKKDKVEFAGISDFSVDHKNLQTNTAYNPNSLTSGTSDVKEKREVKKNKILRIEDDFVTCPNCRILNPIDAKKCSVCGKEITG